MVDSGKTTGAVGAIAGLFAAVVAIMAYVGSSAGELGELKKAVGVLETQHQEDLVSKHRLGEYAKDEHGHEQAEIQGLLKKMSSFAFVDHDHGDDNRSESQFELPIGSIIAWHKDLRGVPSKLPDGWVECNGPMKQDPESEIDMTRIENLNGAGRFLRGRMISGVPQEDMIQEHGHKFALKMDSAGNHNHTYQGAPYCDHCGGKTNNSGSGNPRKLVSTNSTGNHTHTVAGSVKGVADSQVVGEETCPVNMSVVWIIRVK